MEDAREVEDPADRWGQGGSETRRKERRMTQLRWAGLQGCCACELGRPTGERGGNGPRQRVKAERGSRTCAGSVRGESRWATEEKWAARAKSREREKKKIKFLFYFQIHFQTISKAFEIILNFAQNHSSQKYKYTSMNAP